MIENFYLFDNIREFIYQSEDVFLLFLRDCFFYNNYFDLDDDIEVLFLYSLIGDDVQLFLIFSDRFRYRLDLEGNEYFVYSILNCYDYERNYKVFLFIKFKLVVFKINVKKLDLNFLKIIEVGIGKNLRKQIFWVFLVYFEDMDFLDNYVEFFDIIFKQKGYFDEIYVVLDDSQNRIIKI